MDRTLVVGLDLGNKNSQLCVLNNKTLEVEQVYWDKNSEVYQIPTMVAVTTQTKRWLYGQDAVKVKEYQEGMVIEHFLEGEETAFMVLDAEFTRCQIIEKFLRRMLLLLKREYPNDSILKLVVCLETFEEAIRREVIEALYNLGLYEERVRIIGREQSFMYYTLSQKKELWMNDVGLFQLMEDKVVYSQLSVNRRNRPLIVKIEGKEEQPLLPYVYSEGEEEIQSVFNDFANRLLHKQVISTIYITGVGAEEKWMEACVRKLCVGRRVFVGQNLFCQGACLCAKAEVEYLFKEYMFLSDEVLTTTFSMKVYTQAEEKEVVLVKEGSPWYEVKEKLQVILDDMEELILYSYDVITKAYKEYTIPIDWTKGRPERTTRIEIRVHCIDQKHMVVTLKDMGFGKIYPETNRVYESVIEL